MSAGSTAFRGHVKPLACLKPLVARDDRTFATRSAYIQPEVNVHDCPGVADYSGADWSKEGRSPTWFNAVTLVIWLLAGAVAFLHFAFDTSPWDTVTLRVPGNQDNWWHVLVGAPFFLAYPIIWLRFRSLFSKQLSTAMGRRFIWSAVGLSIAATVSVQVPFLLHLAGTSEWQRLAVLSLGFGIVVASTILLFLRRDHLFPTRACIVGLDTAYLANTALCLVVYGGATGTTWSRSGWLVSMVIVWAIVFEVAWLFMQTFRTEAPSIGSHVD
jgi:hypothetical protein